MKLKAMEIHNFRSVTAASIKFDSYALIVGANNCGKSTVVDCLRAFYEKDGYKFKREADIPLKDPLDAESWVDLTFDLRDEEYESLKEEYQAGGKLLKVRKYFITKETLHDGKSAAGVILGYRVDGTLSNEPFYGAKNVQSGKFGDLIYIPAISKVDDHAKLSGPSALRDLISNIMTDVVEGSEDYRSLESSVSAFANAVRSNETHDRRSLGRFESDLNEFFAPWQTKFRLKFTTPSTAEIIKSMLGWEIEDSNHGQTQGIEYFGSGFQRHFIYSLIQLGAKYLPHKAPTQKKEFGPSMNLLLFEEPEAFLHPPQQEELARNLIQMGRSHEWQVICTSHSAHFVSRNAARIPSIIRLTKKQGIASAHQVRIEEWDGIVGENQAINARLEAAGLHTHEDDWKPEMEAIKYFLWINPDRAGMLFAQTVLLVEGPSETALINRLRDEGHVTLPTGTYVMDTLGKYNMHRFINLLSRLGVDHAVLCDDDNNIAKHEILNELIRNSRTEFTKAVVTIPGNLEALLGVDGAKRNDRKPQHLLYLYDSGGIETGKLEQFCTMVTNCFGLPNSR